VSAGNVLTLTPPLVVTAAQLDEALDILQESIRVDGGAAGVAG
jgi:4-aminobutyrate aminotransferase-like enzyme